MSLTMKRTNLAMWTAASIVLAACGGTSLATSADPVSELVASCGNDIEFSSIPPDITEFPPLDDDAQQAIDELVNGPTGVEAGGFADAEFFIADRSGDSLSLFGPSETGDSFLSANFRREDDQWRPSSWGGCRITISTPGFGAAATRLDPDLEPDPASTTLNLIINERECASGQAPVDREVVPVVIETEDQVEIITMVEPVSGGAECPGNPWFPVIVELDAPLGDRTVVDGHMYPGQDLNWPPDLGF